MVTMRQQIIDNAVAHGVDRAAVTAYIDKLLAIPKKVPPTKLDVDTAAALAKISSLQGYLDRLHGKNITLTVTQQGNANKLLGMQGRAIGGPVLAGVPYIVGERRPELFVPDQNGTIVPQVPAPAAKGGFGSSASGAKFNVEHMTVVGYNPDDAVQRFGHEIQWQMAGAT
jgi:hypothetical protein